jgi:hypothetical protein
MDVPSPFLQWPVTIKLYSDLVLLGEDVGWVSFAEPFLHFQGRRTEFSLLGTDVLLKYKQFITMSGWLEQSSTLSNSAGFQLSWRDGRGNELLVLEPLHTSSENEHQILEEMGPILSQWQQLAKVPDLVGIFPPNFANPEVVVRTRQRVVRCQRLQKLIPFGTAYLVLAVYLLSKEPTQIALLLVSIVLLGVVLGCVNSRLVRDGLIELERIPQDVLDSRRE